MIQPLQEDIEFLEHFGVRGMRWGSRKSSGNETTETKKTSRIKTKTKLKLAAYAGAAVAGVVFANKFMNSHGNKKVSVAVPYLNYTDRSGQKVFDYTHGIAAIRKIKIKDLAKMAANNYETLV